MGNKRITRGKGEAAKGGTASGDATAEPRKRLCAGTPANASPPKMSPLARLAANTPNAAALSDEPTDKEILEIGKDIPTICEFARHFYRLGYEKGLKEGLNAPSDRMLMMNTALLKEAEQRGREQGWKDCLTKLESYNPKLTLGVILALNGTALRKEGKEGRE